MNSVAKMCCKVCKDAGKEASVYESHWVRKRGVVVCPTLLSQSCGYCGKNGHTPKYCKASLKTIDVKRNVVAPVKLKVEERKTPTSYFAILMDSDCDSDDEENEAWPALREDLSSSVAFHPHQESYAEMLAKKPEPKKTEPVKLTITEIPKESVVMKIPRMSNWNWADDESSSDEDESMFDTHKKWSYDSFVQQHNQ